MAKISIEELTKAVLSLEEAISFVNKAPDSTMLKICRDAAIQRFEFCIELSWKVSAKILGSLSAAPKPVVREMAQNGLIDDPKLWLEFIEARNRTSHSYDEQIAQQVYQVVVQFLPEVQDLASELKKK